VRVALPIELPIAAIAALCRKYRVSELSIFGSALRPDFGEHRDLDLLVTFKPDAAIGLEYVQLQRELAAVTGRQVDLVSKKGLKPVIREQVLAEAQVLYEDREALPG
jgi:predicted nucleotidyltransferase